MSIVKRLVDRCVLLDALHLEQTLSEVAEVSLATFLSEERFPEVSHLRVSRLKRALDASEVLERCDVLQRLERTWVVDALNGLRRSRTEDAVANVVTTLVELDDEVERLEVFDAFGVKVGEVGWGFALLLLVLAFGELPSFYSFADFLTLRIGEAFSRETICHSVLVLVVLLCKVRLAMYFMRQRRRTN